MFKIIIMLNNQILSNIQIWKNMKVNHFYFGIASIYLFSLIHALTMKPMLTWDLLYSLGWTRTQDSLASASSAQGL
jgi:hypothetical protein